MRNDSFNKYINIWKEAREEAQKAVDKCDIKPNQFNCGFSWIRISGRGNFAKYTKLLDLSQKHFKKGRTIWYSKIYDGTSQDMDIHIVACNAFAEVLRKHNIKCSVELRLDQKVTKMRTIQNEKDILIKDRKTGRVYDTNKELWKNIMNIIDVFKRLKDR